MKEETRSFYEAAVLRAVRRIAGGLDEALDLEAIAKEAALSPFHFHRVFRGMVGETPLELHRRLRLERAASQLAEGDAPVVAIAFDAGYETHEAFTRTFRAAFGGTPSAFRQRAIDERAACHGPPIHLPAPCGLHVHGGAVDLAALVFHHGGDSAMDVIIEHHESRRLATVPHVGPPQTIAEAFHRLLRVATATSLYDHAEPAMLAVHHDEEHAEAALVMRDAAPLPEELTELRLPAGRYAKVTHRGAYSGLGDTWARLMGVWLPQSGERVRSSPSYEVFVSDPRTTPTEELRTDLYLPLE